VHVIIYNLFGALFTVAVALALGSLLLRKLSLPLYRIEERLFSFLVGSACLSMIVFAMAVIKVAQGRYFFLLGSLIIGYALFKKVHRPKGNEFPPLPRMWTWLFAVVFTAFTILYFVNAMAPEMSSDGMSYHLGEVSKYYRAHGFLRITTNVYANLPQGIEMLFLHGYPYGGHSTAAMIHFSFLLCLALQVLSYGRRIGYPACGVAGALFTYASPIVGQVGTVAYVDVALASIAFAIFYLLQIWSENKEVKLLVPIGILTGFSFATKYTAFLAIPYVLGFIAWKLWRTRQPVLRHVFITALLALVFIAPWLVKNWMWADNPFSPFFNRLFPNQYVHVSFEDDYRKSQATYGLASYWQIPLQITIRGDALGGMFGPLFLLAPLGLLALRSAVGRQLWLAALVFGLPFYASVGARFLIPAVPFISLALALAVASASWILPALVLVHAITCWPSVVNRYCAPGAWHLARIPIKAALRIESLDAYLSRWSQPYNSARLIEKLVPQGERVFAFATVGDAHTTHEILLRFRAPFNEVLGDILWTPLFAAYQPSRILKFQFAPQSVRKLRVYQTAHAKDVIWGVSELRVRDEGKEIPRAPEWRLTAHPNPWDVQLAFDNSPVTRWRSWQTAEPGMFIEVDFGHPQNVDSVVIQSSDESNQTKLKVDGMDAQNKWTTLSSEAQEFVSRSPVNLRLAATSELKARGVRYLLIEKYDLKSEDFEMNSDLWGIKCIGERKAARLYQIE
jgi:4-amino-4-deoxy-L-arabinose transferase-like glycosyltransferase